MILGSENTGQRFEFGVFLLCHSLSFSLSSFLFYLNVDQDHWDVWRAANSTCLKAAQELGSQIP